MSASLAHPKRGDRFTWGITPYPLFIEVTRVARDGSWADIRVQNWACMWTKRQPLPMPNGTTARAWTAADVAATVPTDDEIQARLGGAS